MWLYDEKKCSHKGLCGRHCKEHQGPEDGEGRPSTEGRTRKSVSGNRLRVNMSSEWQGKQSSKAREEVRSQVMTDCDMCILLLYHGML